MKKPTKELWLPGVAGAIGGAALMIIIVALGYQLIFPALCTLDGTLWAAWAQAIGIAVTGISAAVIAFRQLGVSIKAMRLQNTINVSDDVYNELTLNEMKISPMDATALLHKTAFIPENLAAFIAAYQRITTGGALPGTEPNAERISAAIAAVNNYFGGLWMLLQKGALDEDFVLNRFANICLGTYHDLYTIRARPPRVEMSKMALASYEYLKASGADVTPPQPF